MSSENFSHTQKDGSQRDHIGASFATIQICIGTFGKFLRKGMENGKRIQY
jgi:hypothetical protein